MAVGRVSPSRPIRRSRDCRAAYASAPCRRRKEILEIGGREVTITNPDKVYFPETGYTKLDLVPYYLAVADGALRGAGGRPMALKRFVDGDPKEPFFQKRAPDNTPDWIRTAS